MLCLGLERRFFSMEHMYFSDPGKIFNLGQATLFFNTQKVTGLTHHHLIFKVK